MHHISTKNQYLIDKRFLRRVFSVFYDEFIFSAYMIVRELYDQVEGREEWVRKRGLCPSPFNFVLSMVTFFFIEIIIF